MPQATDLEIQYLEEVEAALQHDSTRLGHVWRNKDKSPKQIADEANVPTPGFVYNLRTVISTMIDGRIPDAPTIAQHAGRAIRGFVTRHGGGQYLSDTTARMLIEIATACDQATSDPVKINEEQENQKRRTVEAETHKIPGIYVYSYPHYIRHPVVDGGSNEETGESSSDRTYLKIGKSRNVSERLGSQRHTALPEALVPLRIYKCDESSIDDMERHIHEHLRSADHGRMRIKGTGKEWFLTHLDLIDSTARLLKLETVFSYEN